MLVRREVPADVEAIDRVHRAAFEPPEPGAEPVEVALVQALRADAGWIPALSLVAEGADGQVVGHVVCSLGHLDRGTAVGLGPVGVLPQHQGDGVGGALMHAALAGADALDVAVVVLLGHLDYYPRFGFVPASTLGIEPEDPEWGAHLQARTLAAWTPACGGRFRYAAPFAEL
jgi:putative acetyltransferase